MNGPVAVRRRRPAAAAAELVVILFLLITIVLGCVDFGRFSYYYIAVTNGARAGAGFGSVNTYTTATYPVWQAQVKQAVVDEMSATYGFDASKLTVTVSVVYDTPTLWRAQVVASYPFTTIISWPGIPASMTLQRQVAMRMVR
jgi:Flp pilus assembly protein TadG